ncbi:MAG TPA: Fe-S protein assembly co-chaperone HscB [Vicinamibacterales bacterium]|nr:Fe-S protein assembly co-chaperone HscB [Vicinamibacterales bacterium]
MHFCPQCSKILSLGRHGDFFAFLGVPRKLNLDAADLERRFRELSRQFHPDYFYNATPAERRASLERSSYLNDAYRTLKNPVTRIEYLLKLEGLATAGAEHGGSGRASVPPALLEEVFALNEELDDIRGARSAGAPRDEIAARLARARLPIERKRDEHARDLEALAAKWDASGDRDTLAALHDRILERNYINNLLATIEQEANA